MLFALAALGFLFIAAIPAAAETATNVTIPVTDAVQPFRGVIGPDNPLYGFRLSLENIDESFTLNQTEKLEKMINRTELRLAELESALAANQTDAVNRTLDQYLQKYNQTEDTLERLAFNDTISIPAPNGTPARNLKDTGLTHALANLNQHQVTFQNLMQAHPDNTGLVRAYNNSLERQLKFEEKIREHSRFGEINGTTDGQHKNRDLNQTANLTGPKLTPPGRFGPDNQSGNETASQGINKGGKQAGNAVKGNDNSKNPDNQPSQDRTQQQVTTTPARGQQTLDEKGNQQGKNIDNNAAGSQKNNNGKNSDSNNGNSAGKGNRNQNV